MIEPATLAMRGSWRPSRTRLRGTQLRGCYGGDRQDLIRAIPAEEAIAGVALCWGDGGDSVRIDELMATAKDTLTVGRVYGEPYERDGVTVIPAATVAGGGGGGTGRDPEGQEGEGGGFGMNAKPAGVYVLDAGTVRWRPAVDVNRLVGTVAAVLIMAMITRVRLVRLRSRASGGR
jgi:uncharacterized spore protein YtfJ